ncbi:integrating conjugative element protein, PFL_4704 family [Serratia liquefaciens]|nr:integrating conjugative element protein, PFL_4704 family [Serratia liquefaciens]
MKYNAPLPVVLTRYAAQSLYGPVRTVEAVPGIHPVNPHLPKRITTLYPSEPVSVTPLGGWGIGSRNVVALKVQNTASRKITLDPRVLQGQFVTATFQHPVSGASRHARGHHHAVPGHPPVARTARLLPSRPWCARR